MTHKESIALFPLARREVYPGAEDPGGSDALQWLLTRGLRPEADQRNTRKPAVPASNVFPQSFDIADVRYWIKAEPGYGAQAIYLIDDESIPGLNGMDPATWGGAGGAEGRRHQTTSHRRSPSC